MTEKHKNFKKFLIDSEIEVIDAADFISRKEGWVSFYSSDDIQKAVDVFLANHIEALVIGCWHWTNQCLLWSWLVHLTNQFFFIQTKILPGPPHVFFQQEAHHSGKPHLIERPRFMKEYMAIEVRC